MKRIISVAIVLAVALFFTMKQTPNDGSVNGKPVVKIGTVFPLTGNMAHIGLALQGGADTAVEHANKNPENKYVYEIVSEDSLLNMSRTATIANKMVSLDKIDAIISFAADVGNALVPIAEKNKVIHFAMSVDPHGAEGKYNFINWTMPESSTGKMSTVIQEKGFKNVAIVAFNQSGALANSEMLNKKLGELGIESNLYVFNSDIRDFRLDIRKMDAKGTDLYVLRMFDPQISIFIKQLREAGISKPITSVEAFNWVEDKSIIDGYWYVDMAGDDNHEVIKEIKQRNQSDVNYGVAMAYDDVMLIVKAFEETESRDKAIDRLLEIKNYEGIAGSLQQDETGIFHSEAMVKIIGGNK